MRDQRSDWHTSILYPRNVPGRSKSHIAFEDRIVPTNPTVQKLKRFEQTKQFDQFQKAVNPFWLEQLN